MFRTQSAVPEMELFMRYLKNQVIQGTLILTIAGFITRLIGFVYRCLLYTSPDVVLNGSLENRLDANVSFGFRGIESQSLILFLDMEGICVSGGSACTLSLIHI